MQYIKNSVDSFYYLTDTNNKKVGLEKMKNIIDTLTSKPIGSTIHIFEASGLGKAPFTYVRHYVKSGSCDYCNTGIVHNFELRSSDNKVFKVGCNCIEKSGDLGLCKVVSAIKSAQAKVKREEKKKRDIQAFRDLKESHRVLLESLPHPYLWKKDSNMFNYISCFSYKNGMAYLIKVLNDNGVT